MCLELENSFKCICNKGWYGDECDIPKCEILNPCGNNGIFNLILGKCIDMIDKLSYRCECYKGFRGKNCSEAFCQSNDICFKHGFNL